MVETAENTPAAPAASIDRSHLGKVALVTGGSRGIGLAVAEGLAARGASVIVVAIDDMSDATARLRAAGGEHMFIDADVSEQAGWDHIKQKALSTFEAVDIVINNAGIYPSVHIDDLDYDVWRKVMSVNLDSMFYSAKAFSPQMVERRWGRFVNITSGSINSNTQRLSHYMASKMGVIGFTRGLANDLGQSGVTVNAVGPALTQTQAIAKYPEEVVARVVGLQSIPRLAQPSDIAGPVIFLTTEDARFITGHTIMVDGGFSKP